MNFLDLIKNAKIENSSKLKRGRKPKLNLEESCEMASDYRPAGWLDSSLSFTETVSFYESLKKKKKNLTEDEKIIVHNYEILKSCYRTPKHILKLARIFIGKFNFDPFYNTYGFTSSSEFAERNFKKLSGYSFEDDGFSLPNWYDLTSDLEEVVGWCNPPFNKLENAAQLINVFSKEPNVRFAFLCTLDYTNYLQDCLKLADYFIMLGRVQFLPMPGINVSTARGSVGMLIYNSQLQIDNSQFINSEGNIYYCINLKNQREIQNLNQLSLGEWTNLGAEKCSVR